MHIEQQAAQALLEKGLKVRVTAPLILRVFGKKQLGITIRPTFMGTRYRMSDLYKGTGIPPEQLGNLAEGDIHDYHLKYGKGITKVAAQAWLNNYYLGVLFGWLVWRWLYWHLTELQLMNLADILVIMNDRTPFTNTIRLLDRMTITRPNLSQQIQGS